MGKLNDLYYDAVVISDEIDPNHGGAVRIKVLGVTDELKKDDQPFALPAVGSMMAVPTKDTILRIAFDEGDINKPKYFSASPQKSYLPESYVGEYPNMAVSNLGGDLFLKFHDRENKNTLITHPSDSVLIWNDFGTIIHDSDNGYNNAGQGANKENGSKIHPVLTEASIDIFTCTPFSGGGARRGSEYLQVTHVSQSTVDAINGTGGIDSNTDADQFEPTGIDTSIVNNLLDADGNSVGTVTFLRSPTIVELNTKRNPTTILIGLSGNNDFVKTSQTIIDKNSQLSAHYLIGKNAPPPEAGTEGSNIDRSGGFAQFVELKNDANFGNRVPSTKNIINKANKNAISIMLIGTSGKTDYQNNTINIIIEHVKQNFKITSQDIVIQDVGFLG